MLLAFDLDGTIVTRKHTLPRDTRKALDYARSKGHHVTVITGRTAHGAKRYLRALQVPGLFGTCNGSRVHGLQGSMMHETLLGAEQVQLVAELLRSHRDVKFFMSGPDHVFLHDPLDPFFAWCEKEGHTVLDVGQLQPEKVNKVVLYGDDLSVLHSKLQPLVVGEYYPWGRTVLEILPQGTSKGHALSLLAQHHGYDASEVVAFGDGINDISMFEWAGTGIAVGHAGEHLKSLAQEHVPEPEKKGVIQWIYQNL